jgi:AcrR family transcriptional regulator
MTSLQPVATSSTRERLIEATFTVVARDGLEATSVKTIAAEAGITPGLLHYHFPTKDALLEAALRRATESYAERLAALRSAHPPGLIVAAYLEETRRAVDEHAAFFRVRLAFAARALSDPGLGAVMCELNRAAIEETAGLLAADRGASEANADDGRRAALLKACFDGIMLAYLLNPDFPLDAAVAFFEAGLNSP